MSAPAELVWEDATGGAGESRTCRARWRSENGQAPPRRVVVADELARYFKECGQPVAVEHRDLERSRDG